MDGRTDTAELITFLANAVGDCVHVSCLYRRVVRVAYTCACLCIIQELEL